MKKIILSIAFLYTCFSLSSCIKESTTLSYAELQNNTDAKIRITLYTSGMPIQDYPIVLEKGEKMDVSTNHYFGKGKLNNPGFKNDYLINADSLIVTFNDTFQVTHYRNIPFSRAANSYIPFDSRCLMNVNNWQHSVVEEKNVLTNYYKYSFNQQDYHAAKK